MQYFGPGRTHPRSHPGCYDINARCLDEDEAGPGDRELAEMDEMPVAGDAGAGGEADLLDLEALGDPGPQLVGRRVVHEQGATVRLQHLGGGGDHQHAVGRAA